MHPSKSKTVRWAGSRALPLQAAADLLGVTLDDAARASARRLPFRFPAGYLDLVRRDDPDDPIRRIAWPTPDELRADEDAIDDPVGEGRRKLHPLVIQKYADRALLLVTSRCHFYCRFCFRAGQDHDPDISEVLEAIDLLSTLPGLHEVILSGGDPLVLTDEALARILTALRRLPALKTVRIHSRAPVHDPARITQQLAHTLVQSSPAPLRMAIHTSHPRELRPEFTVAISSLRAAGIGLLNQTVLLGGVNARLETLAEHFAALYALGVKPYYLHHPDRVAGTPGFRVSIEQGLALYRALRGCIPGPAMPLYVIDLPDGSGKIPVEWLNRTADGSYRIEHPSGAVSHYCDIEQPSLID